jgi:phenylalanyl-tRNA synthetase beta chain
VKVPLSWLKEYVDWPWSPGELAERLTMAGVKIEAVLRFGEGSSGVVAARVLEVTPHPNPAPGAGRHWVVDLDAGGPKRQAVAGIANMRPGDIVAYAPPGALLPGGWKIDVANVRGVTSEGMLLSLSELALGEKPREGEGILILPADLAPGADLCAALGLPESVLELDLTPNYAAFCQSLAGVAREVAALTGAGPDGVRYPDPLARFGPAAPGRGGGRSVSSAAELAKVSIADPDLCPRYLARVVRGVTLGVSPWLVQLRLLAAGMRPINNIVDATNYVMLESGQPLHAFDLERVSGRHIIVRRAKEGESIVTLDGVSRTLTGADLVIADESGPVAVAGVMGGQDSEVRAGTGDVLLESASFDPMSVRRTATRLALPSEAAGRFDKGTDPAVVDPASARAAALIAEFAGGTVAPGSADANPRPYAPRELTLRSPRVAALLGVDLGRSEVSDCLRLLGFGVRQAAWQPEETGADRPDLVVTTPSWRPDVSEEADLIEEVARLYGYDKIPASLPRGATTVGVRPIRRRLEDRARGVGVSLGFAEVLRFSMVDPERDALFSPVSDPAVRPLLLANPLAAGQTAMRRGLLGGLVESLVYNRSRGETDLRLFEVGRVYWPPPGELGPGNLPLEKTYLAAVSTGAGPDVSWQSPGKKPDFYAAKGLAETVLRDLGVDGWSVRPSHDRRFHPGRQAALVSAAQAGPDQNPVELAVFGELHPGLLSAVDIEEKVTAVEVDLDAVGRVSTVAVRVEELPRYPAVTRDVAVVLPEEVGAGRIHEVIRASAGRLCAGVELFDLYRGQPVPEGRRSTAWRVTYRSPDRSLTDAEVDEAHGRVRAALEKDLKAALR